MTHFDPGQSIVISGHVVANVQPTRRWRSLISPARPVVFLMLFSLCLGVAYGVSQQEWPRDRVQLAQTESAENEALGSAYELSLSENWPGVLGRSSDGRLTLFSTNFVDPKISLIKSPLSLITDVGRLVGDSNSLPVYLAPKTEKEFIVDSAVNQYFRTLSTPVDHTVTAACLLHEGRQIIVCAIDEDQSLKENRTVSKIRWIDLDQRKLLYQLETDELIFDVAYDSVTETSYLASRAGIFSNRLGTCELYELSCYPTRSLQISTASRMLITGHFNGEVTGFNLDIGAERWMTFTGRSCTIKNVAVAPDNERLVAVSGELSYVLILDAATGKLISKLDQSAPATNSIAFSREGGQLIVSLCDSRIVVWDLTQRKTVQTWQL